MAFVNRKRDENCSYLEEGVLRKGTRVDVILLLQGLQLIQ